MMSRTGEAIAQLLGAGRGLMEHQSSAIALRCAEEEARVTGAEAGSGMALQMAELALQATRQGTITYVLSGDEGCTGLLTEFD
jgi:hypothetical protein